MDWTASFFDELYLMAYEPSLKEKTSREADLIEKLLLFSPEHEILDVPCGFGRHAVEFSKRGYKVTGLEYNDIQIERAKSYMEENGQKFEIIQGDMRDLPFENKFDRLYDYYTSIGYFSDEENEKAIHEFYKALKPGGMMLIETQNRDSLLNVLQKSTVIHLPDGSLVLKESDFNPLESREISLFTYIVPNKEAAERVLILRLYSAHELISICKKAGFEIIGIYGNHDEPFNTFSSRIKIVAQKPY